MLNVTLMAHTTIADHPSGGDEGRATLDWLEWDDNVQDADHLAEFAGRACYQSFDKPNPKTRENKDYIANILKQQHFSVLEHASATFYIQGVSRALTHELIRHRHLSYSQLSQRYVDASDSELVMPPAIAELIGDPGEPYPGRSGNQTLEETSLYLTYEAQVRKALQVYTDLANMLEQRGLNRKQAREAARSVLPNATETKIVVTGNHRAWRDVISKRNSPSADAEIKLLAEELLRQLKQIAPNTYQDME